MRLSMLMDQLNSPAGGGRFTRGLIQAWCNLDGQERLADDVVFVSTQGETVNPCPLRTCEHRVLRRRFPSRWRYGVTAGLFGRTLPEVDVAYGPFFYAFPRHGRRKVVTVHDMSFLHEQFHPAEYCRRQTEGIARVLSYCDVAVCVSESTANALRQFVSGCGCCIEVIYNGVGAVAGAALGVADRGCGIDGPFLLTVGTVEPRKNYGTMLAAFERLVSQSSYAGLKLVVVGASGWASASEVARLRHLSEMGSVVWVSDCTDGRLASLYAAAQAFTYLSVYEGFGYPPFEAACAGLPMVLSDTSAVGEIWRHHACCVNPRDVDAIVEAWKWALEMPAGVRAEVLGKQRACAASHKWEQCAIAYRNLFERLAG